MQHTTMVRAYLNQAAFATDEQQLGQHGWSVASTGSTDQQLGMLARLRARVVAAQAAAPIVVTYPRGQPR